MNTITKKILLTLLFLPCYFLLNAQKYSPNSDSLKQLLKTTSNDTSRVLLMADLSWSYAFSNVDTSILYAQKAINSAQQLNHKRGEAAGLASYGWAFWALAKYDKAIELGIKSLNLYAELKDYPEIVSLNNELAVFYRDAEDYSQALKHAILSKSLFDSLHLSNELVGTSPSAILGSIYIFTNQIDSASLYINKAYQFQKRYGKYESGYMLNLLGSIEAKKQRYDQALNYYWSAIQVALSNKNYFDLVYTYTYIARLYQTTGNIDSSIYYAKEIINKLKLSFYQRGTLDALTILAQNYKLRNLNDSAIKYLDLRIALNDSLFNKDKIRAVQNLTFNEQLQLQEIGAAKIQYQNEVKLYAVFAIAGIFLLIGIILYRNNKLKQKANVLLQQQKQKIETTLSELKSTQAQLIQSEKMASLGELTAGIAHEIQNPLNFVNNFSEVNSEMIEELKNELATGNLQLANEIADDIKSNEQKINHHGKRADAIVKSMLEHSRSSTGIKEPTDINKLADEYLRLSYHGLRAKDKSFNAEIKTDFDQSIGKINLIPQDIGRVLLNLYNNAFYACAERSRSAVNEKYHAIVDEEKSKENNWYKPTVWVTTKREENSVTTTVRDNGGGIPDSAKEKIFQPFFTTKPTGEGTGLGLSLSYDIVKAHGGEINVVSDGAGATFTIVLP